MLNLFLIIVGAAASAAVSGALGFFSEFSVLSIVVPSALWLGFYVAASVAVFLYLLISSKLLSKKPPEKPGKYCGFVVGLVVGWLRQMGRIKLHVRNGELVERNKQYLIVSNHRSMYDPILQLNAFGRARLMMISKPENFKLPIAGPYMRRAGFLAIDRNNDREALKTILKAIDFVKKYGVSVGVCPEGTRNRIDRNVMPMRAGAFKIATKSKIPIVVTTLEGTENIHKNYPWRRTHVYLDVVKVITPEEYEGMQTSELAELVRGLMQRNVDSYKVR